ncbi:MAG: valyl-tRNA synthetase [Chloroflexi bacterium]|jgi:valyl-tRNA synthetase|nr:MAG: valyl-tRNA synthetase [Chloroflexota bacterium]
MTTSQKPQEIPKAYEPNTVEQRLYQNWEERGYFTPSPDPDKEPFVIIMPPPNVTGSLHLGHGITASLQDALTRWHRMLGKSALWLPGTDHAGIATQMVVERDLATEGLTRHQLGREKFVERVWEWVAKYGSIITQQHKSLGASCDWTREAFTLDPGPARAVRTTFVNLYNKGLIYRGERIINWCPRCGTALSDLEVNHQMEAGKLYHLRYPIEGDDGYLVVATTRPETMVADTAVAVNPDDPRHNHLIGKTVLLPIIGRSLPIIGDEAVEVEFGTGALKVTPGHDATDFEVGQRHGLPVINAMNLDATMNEQAGPYAGMDRFAAREAIVKELEEQGLVDRLEDYQVSLGHCQRCDTVVEPLVSKQWFVQMEPLAKPAIEAVRDGTIKIVPERFVNDYMHWMTNIRDWCISRQLWWGHRIPVWYCDDCGHEMAAVEAPERCESCQSAALTQDLDVLDTWFSSGLWPHSTLGWPDDTEDLRYFYPTTVMETGYDIIFFWVARMVMLGIENMGEAPFKTIYLHGLVRDAQGKKMSKTSGNVMDPLDLVKEYGADALRVALMVGVTPGNDMRLSPTKVEAGRNFANKLWNAARFVSMSLEGQEEALQGWSNPTPQHRHDRWIMSRLALVTRQVNTYLEQFQIGEAARVLQDFLWSEYCDWFIEVAKVRLRNEPEAPSPLPFLAHVLEQVLRLLHPFMPFITEEVWQNLIARLPSELPLPDSIMLASYPTDAGVEDKNAEEEMALTMSIVRAIRAVRAEFKLPPAQLMEAVVEAKGLTSVAVEEEPYVTQLARIGEYTVLAEGQERPSMENAVTLVLSQAAVLVPLGGLVDLAAERRRLEKELAEGQQNMQRLEGRLGDAAFLEKAPDNVIERERERLASLQEQGMRLREFLAQLGG